MTDSLPMYEELQLRVRPGQRGGYRVEAVAPDGSRAAGRFRLPVDETQLDNFVLQVGQPRRSVRKFRSPQMERAKEFGGRLFDALVAGEVRDLYRAARSGAEARGKGLRVTLCLTEVPTLMSVPWEFLFERPSFIAQSIYTPLVRSLDLKYVRRPPPVALPLHILGMVSRPKGVTALDVDGEQRRLADALAPLSEAGLVRLEWLGRATLSDLHEAISRPGEIHVLHYIGHGAYDERTESGILLLEDDDGLRHEVTGEELGTLLQDEHSLRLVVLNSCEGARTSHVDPFSGVASSLVEVGIPAVIGMQFEITDEAAVTFGGSLYKALVQGYPVDAALAQVRKAIFAARHDVEFGTPVLFLRATDAHLFDFQEATPLPEQVAPETAECDLTVDLVQNPTPSRHGEQITWQLTIANTGGCTLEEITARDESGDQLAPPVRLTPGTTHIVRWRETADPDARHLITVTARAPDGSTIAEQTTASTSATIEETAESTHPADERVPTADPRYLQGVDAFYAGRWEEAVDRFAAVANEYPDDDRVCSRLEEARRRRDLTNWYHRGAEAEQQDDWDAAVTAFQRVAPIDSDYQDAADRLQHARHEQQKTALVDDIRRLHAAGQWTAVVAAGEELSTLDPDSAGPDDLISAARAALADEQLNARYTEGLHQLDRHDWAAALGTFTGIEQDRPGYRDTRALRAEAQARQQDQQREQQITTLQRQLRQQFDQADWAAVQATSNELAQIDPDAANPDGLATRAAEELEKSRLAEHPPAGQAAPPSDDRQPRSRPRRPFSRRVWILAAAGVVLLLLGVVIVANLDQGGGVIFEDDFSSSASGWEEWSVNGVSAGGDYKDGAYLVSAEADDAAGGDPHASSVYPSAPSSINIEVEASQITGSAEYGILCRSTSEGWYAFIVRGESVRIWRQGSSGGADVVEPRSAQIDENGTNELFATCDGGEDAEGKPYVYLQLLVNGQTVAETTDHTPLPAGTVGLFVDTRQTGTAAEVQFDNFVVTQV